MIQNLKRDGLYATFQEYLDDVPEDIDYEKALNLFMYLIKEQKSSGKK